jgi:hypothetical protein
VQKIVIDRSRLLGFDQAIAPNDASPPRAEARLQTKLSAKVGVKFGRKK